MKTVHKFPIDKLYTLSIPANAKILFADFQGIQPSVWIELDPNDVKVNRKFTLYGTGWDIADEEVWRATFQQGPYVWHIYETTK